LITSDKEQLKESIGISGERQSATELARKAAMGEQKFQRLPDLTVEHNVESARNWVLRQAAQSIEQVPDRNQVLKPELTVQQVREQKTMDYGLSI